MKGLTSALTDELHRAIEICPHAVVLHELLYRGLGCVIDSGRGFECCIHPKTRKCRYLQERTSR